MLECLNEDGQIETNGIFFSRENAEDRKEELDNSNRNKKYSIKQHIKEIETEDELVDKIQLKTSFEWAKDCKYTILDPDGWDRKNFKFSWYQEQIAQQEFDNRVLLSSVIYLKDES
jgi:hypothetical protein|tara:strand:- start:259 stop:606 length:348 start_codon:yes stop_codon:yes gene_type:complete